MCEGDKIKGFIAIKVKFKVFFINKIKLKSKSFLLKRINLKELSHFSTYIYY